MSVFHYTTTGYFSTIRYTFTAIGFENSFSKLLGFAEKVLLQWYVVPEQVFDDFHNGWK